MRIAATAYTQGSASTSVSDLCSRQSIQAVRCAEWCLIDVLETQQPVTFVSNVRNLERNVRSKGVRDADIVIYDKGNLEMGKRTHDIAGGRRTIDAVTAFGFRAAR